MGQHANIKGNGGKGGHAVLRKAEVCYWGFKMLKVLDAHGCLKSETDTAST